MLLSFLGFYGRKSNAKLTIYVYTLGFIFICQLVATVLAIVLKEKIIDLAAEKTSS